MSDTITTEEPVTPAKPEPKKGSIPTWVALLVIVICFGAVYVVYNKMTSQVTHVFKPVKHAATRLTGTKP